MMYAVFVFSDEVACGFSAVQGKGGGLVAYRVFPLTLMQCTFFSNTAPVVRPCLFCDWWSG